MPHCITLIPGDGIGPEVAEAATKVLDATGVSISWAEQLCGLSASVERAMCCPKKRFSPV